MQSTASVVPSTLSTPSTLTRIRPPWSDHPQVQLCHEVPELAFVMAAVPALRSEVADPVRLLQDLLRASALEMLLIASSLPLIAVCISSRTRGKESAISCLICYCNLIKSAVVAILACYCATAPAAADLSVKSLCNLTMRERESNANSILWHDLSQRKCVGKMVKCT